MKKKEKRKGFSKKEKAEIKEWENQRGIYTTHLWDWNTCPKARWKDHVTFMAMGRESREMKKIPNFQDRSYSYIRQNWNDEEIKGATDE